MRFLIFIFCLTFCLVAVAQENLKRAVALLEVEVPQVRGTDIYIISIGSTFLIGEKNNLLYFATANHTLKDARTVKLQLRDFPKKLSAEITEQDSVADFAVITVEKPEGYRTPNSFKFTSRNPERDEQLITIGFPYGEIWDVNKRAVLREINSQSNLYYIYPDGIAPGSSGGPVLNQDHELVGMVLQIDHGKVLCIKTSVIKDFCNQWDIPVNRMTGEQNYTDPFAGEMVYVKGGSYDMGYNISYSRPIHKVNVLGFYMGKYEITQAQWQKIMGTNPSENKNCDQCPVENVSWKDVQQFIQKLNKQSSYTYRLPTEAEWEYAAGGGEEKRSIYAGISVPEKVHFYGNFCDASCGRSYSKKDQNDRFATTAPVGNYFKNQLGLHDMSGNVSEWCQDIYYYSYKDAPTDGSARTSPENERRVIRGGAWTHAMEYMRVFRRESGDSNYGNMNVGFRLVRDL